MYHQKEASKYIGVTKEKNHKKFRGILYLGGLKKSVGEYPDERKAALAREKALRALVAIGIVGERKFGPGGHFPDENFEDEMAKIDVEEAVTRIKAAAEAHKAAKEERSAKQHREALPQGHSWVDISATGLPATATFMLVGTTDNGAPQPAPLQRLTAGQERQVYISEALMADPAALAAIGTALFRASLRPATTTNAAASQTGVPMLSMHQGLQPWAPSAFSHGGPFLQPPEQLVLPLPPSLNLGSTGPVQLPLQPQLYSAPVPQPEAPRPAQQSRVSLQQQLYSAPVPQPEAPIAARQSQAWSFPQRRHSLPCAPGLVAALPNQQSLQSPQRRRSLPCAPDLVAALPNLHSLQSPQQ